MYLRALQGCSGRNLIDPSLQDNVIIPDGFFKYIYHVGCAINLHSIINSGLIPGGQFEKKTDSILSACGSNGQRTQGSWHDRLGSTASCTIGAWQKDQNTVYWVDINLAIEKGLKFYQIRSNAGVCSQSERSMLNVVDIDSRISGLPHSVVNKLITIVFVSS